MHILPPRGKEGHCSREPDGELEGRGRVYLWVRAKSVLMEG